LKRSSDAQIRDAKLVSFPAPEAGFTDEENKILERSGRRIVVFEVEGPLAFATAKDVAHMLTHSETKEHLIIDFAAVPFIDSTAAMALDEVILRMRQNHFNVAICCARDEVLQKMEKLGILNDLPEDGVFTSRLEAMQHAEKCHLAEIANRAPVVRHQDRGNPTVMLWLGHPNRARAFTQSFYTRASHEKGLYRMEMPVADDRIISRDGLFQVRFGKAFVHQPLIRFRMAAAVAWRQLRHIASCATQSLRRCPS
jgi:anti-anti-sigma regulatory factor